MNLPQYDSIADAAMSLAERRARAELDLVGAVLADHCRLVRVAAAAGVRREHFWADDLALIHRAAVVGVHRDRRGVLLLAAQSLGQHHFWDETQIAGNLGSALWSDASLTALACSWFASATVVTHFARKVIALDARQREAEAAYLRCLTLLRGDYERELLTEGKAAA